MNVKLGLIIFTQICVILLFIPKRAIAEYVSSEILFIPWGDGPDELVIWEPYKEDIYVSEDSSFEAWFASGGPNFGFVDMIDNVYFSSYQVPYLKGFHNDGQGFVNFSNDPPGSNPGLFAGWIDNFYVDSNALIYISSALTFVVVADTLGNIIDRLIPPGYDEHIPVSLLFYNLDDELTIAFLDQMLKYKDGEFTENGYDAWKASDGYYYHAKKFNESSFIFKKFHTYDQIDTFYVSFDGNLHLGGLMGIDLNDQFFIRYTEEEVDIPLGILILDNQFKEVDRFELLPEPENQYMWYLNKSIFLRGDGNVYQFICEDDGMHVIRWRKE
jgi:hypothetical protein